MKSQGIADALERIDRQAKKARRTIHSENHALAKDLSEYCHEPRAFALFLGRIKTIGLPVAYQAFSELKSRVSRGKIKLPGRWWMWKTKHLVTPKKI